jgi:uncharacterized repeat protein (TIGR03843 family)
MPDDLILKKLRSGEINLKGEFVWGSNYTYLVEVSHEDEKIMAVYKPTRGERPLWDFPPASLARREVAAYHVSEALGWRLVPPTVYRKKGPLGPGSVQLFIDHNPDYHYFNFSPEDLQRLRPTVLFDLLVNNADRKGSHVLKDQEGHLWLIDHGICFHVEEKLRTVIWDFVGEPLPSDLCQDIARFVAEFTSGYEQYSSPASSLLEYISLAEVTALARRGEHLIGRSTFPEPDPYRRPFPWPQI